MTLLFTWRGRVGRAAFLGGSFAAFVFGCSVWLGAMILLWHDSTSWRIFNSWPGWALVGTVAALSLVCASVHVSLGIRRLRDIGRSGWHMAWILLCVGLAVPIDDVSPAISAAFTFVFFAGEAWLALAPARSA